MSKRDHETTPIVGAESATQLGQRAALPAPPIKREALPAPPMLWLLIPVALLALLAFLSRS